MRNPECVCSKQELTGDGAQEQFTPPATQISDTLSGSESYHQHLLLYSPNCKWDSNILELWQTKWIDTIDIIIRIMAPNDILHTVLYSVSEED